MKRYRGVPRLVLLLVTVAVLAGGADRIQAYAADAQAAAEAAAAEQAAAEQAAAEQAAAEAAAAEQAAAEQAAAEQAAAAAEQAAAEQAAAEQAAAEQAAAEQAAAEAAAAEQAAAEAAAAEQAAAEAADPEADPEAETETVQPVPSTRKKTQTSVMTEQLKKDIENLLGDTQSAILNGYLSLLNKEYTMEGDLDLDLVSIGNGHQLESKAAGYATQMVKDAKKEGISLNVTSSYRTYVKQVSLFKNKIARLENQGYEHTEAVEKAATVVAVPGTSEHQLGLSLDFVTDTYRKLDEGIRNTKEYQWVAEHAWEYGYVVRYPSGKSDITGIISEPWHLRYVGIPAAKLMSDQDLCLEEFLGVAYNEQKNGISYGAGWVNTGR